MIGFEEGRTRQFDGLDLVITRSAAAEVPSVGAGSAVLLAGIGASHAALATPLQVLRSSGLTAMRSDCSDLRRVPERAPDAVVAVSQSGRSVETADLATRFVAAGVPVLAVTNAEESPLTHIAPHRLTLGGGEDSRVSTVGFVTTFVALSLLAEKWAGVVPEISWRRMPEIAAAASAQARPVLQAFAARHLAAGSADVTASAEDMTAAEAFALLLREGPLVPSTAFGTRAYLHGPMDIAGGAVSHVLLGDEREAQLAVQLRERTEATLLLTTRTSVDAEAGPAVRVPGGLTPCQRALVEVCVLQELLSLTASARGTSVDASVFVRQDTKLVV